MHNHQTEVKCQLCYWADNAVNTVTVVELRQDHIFGEVKD